LRKIIDSIINKKIKKSNKKEKNIREVVAAHRASVDRFGSTLPTTASPYSLCIVDRVSADDHHARALRRSCAAGEDRREDVERTACASERRERQRGSAACPPSPRRRSSRSPAAIAPNSSGSSTIGVKEIRRQDERRRAVSVRRRTTAASRARRARRAVAPFSGVRQTHRPEDRAAFAHHAGEVGRANLAGQPAPCASEVSRTGVESDMAAHRRGAAASSSSSMQ